MPATTTMFRAARPIFRQSPFMGTTARTAFAKNGSARNFSQKTGRRFNSTTTAQAASQGWFRRMMDSPVGFKTVHFWAPVMKWALVLAGVADFARPAEKLSLTQNGALTATGLIWTRWCLIIKPKNVFLATVNAFLAVVGIVQCTRVFLWRSSHKGLPPAAEQVKEEAKEIVKA